MRSVFFVFLMCIFFLSACDQSQSALQSTSDENSHASSIKEAVLDDHEDVSEETTFKPFYVYKDKGLRDNHFIPSGFMPNGNCVKINDRWQEQCQSGSSCIKVNYDVACSRKDQRWAGVYWLNPANNWGRQQGGYDLSEATRMTFWARGEQGGEQVQEFIIGGIEGDYPDSDKIVLGPVILTPQWRQYVIDLTGKDLSYISGGFAWSTEADVNADSCIFYLDDIRFE